MTIQSSTFGGVTLTDEDANAFEEQFVNNPIKDNKLAQSMLDEGTKRWEEYQKNGYVTIKTSGSKND